MDNVEELVGDRWGRVMAHRARRRTRRKAAPRRKAPSRSRRPTRRKAKRRVTRRKNTKTASRGKAKFKVGPSKRRKKAAPKLPITTTPKSTSRTTSKTRHGTVINAKRGKITVKGRGKRKGKSAATLRRRAVIAKRRKSGSPKKNRTVTNKKATGKTKFTGKPVSRGGTRRPTTARPSGRIPRQTNRPPPTTRTQPGFGPMRRQGQATPPTITRQINPGTGFSTKGGSRRGRRSPIQSA